MDIILAQPRGFCSGAIRAIKIVEQAIEKFGPPVYVLHEIVHNRHVVENLKRRGALFVESLAAVPVRAVTIFSAHGVSTSVEKEAQNRQLFVIDATCPLITRIHSQVRQFSRQGFEIVIIGHAGHPEVEGVRGRVEGPVHIVSNIQDVAALKVKDPKSLAYVTQTTLGVEDTRQIILALKERFDIKGPDCSNICYATQARQNSVSCLAEFINILLVVGGRNSSNSNRLREIGEQNGIISHLIEGPEDLDPSWFSIDARVGITAGASAPEEVVQMVLSRLKAFYPCTVRESTGGHEPFIPVFAGSPTEHDPDIHVKEIHEIQKVPRI